MEERESGREKEREGGRGRERKGREREGEREESEMSMVRDCSFMLASGNRWQGRLSDAVLD